jgi:hypothetical protein
MSSSESRIVDTAATKRPPVRRAQSELTPVAVILAAAIKGPARKQFIPTRGTQVKT